MKTHILFLNRKQLGDGLILSKISYCLEATSCCQRGILKIGKKILNRTVRDVCGEWRWENTNACYTAVGWPSLEELGIFRTTIMAKKLLENGGPVRLLERFAVRDGERWKVKDAEVNCRTALMKRAF